MNTFNFKNLPVFYLPFNHYILYLSMFYTSFPCQCFSNNNPLVLHVYAFHIIYLKIVETKFLNILWQWKNTILWLLDQEDMSKVNLYNVCFFTPLILFKSQPKWFSLQSSLTTLCKWDVLFFPSHCLHFSNNIY